LEDNINLFYSSSVEFELTLNSTVTDLKEEVKDISFLVVGERIGKRSV